MGAERVYLLAYDIADPRRLGRVARVMGKECIRVQYSVFVAPLNARALRRVLKAVEREMDATEDDVRVYPLPKNPHWVQWGAHLWDEGVDLRRGAQSLSPR